MVGGDLAGYPNGRRLADDVTDISLKAVAGAAYPLFHPDFKADPLAAQLGDGVDANDVPFRTVLPLRGAWRTTAQAPCRTARWLWRPAGSQPPAAQAPAAHAARRHAQDRWRPDRPPGRHLRLGARSIVVAGGFFLVSGWYMRRKVAGGSAEK